VDPALGDSSGGGLPSRRSVGPGAEEAFVADLAAGALAVEWDDERDLAEANRICRRHKTLSLGLVDAVVMTVAERLRAGAIATLDLRHFSAVPVKGNPKLYPRDLP
jgi:predicted nucleic acid-binding protein